jgi:glutamate N-acetyltransferase/amino-acid N-acetyltransferase
MEILKGNAATAKGFRAAGYAAGIKNTTKLDVAVLTSDVPCVAAGCFTTNVVKAAPVLWDMKNIKNKIQGVVANSGNANACTGEQGLADAEETAAKLAGLMSLEAKNILVCSTGVIGVPLPMEKIKKGVEGAHALLSHSYEGGVTASQAIMTTDTVEKTAAVRVEIKGKPVVIGGMCKGSGMINPNMATMLCFITTDCNISGRLLNKALKKCVADTFNMISVDGDMSTNDTVLALANGMAENNVISDEDDDYKVFCEGLMYVAKTLAIMCADDGEGATKLIEATVKGAKTKDEARTIANSVVSSNLLKAAIFGEDANWGRVLCAMGYSGAQFDPLGVTIVFRSDAGEIKLMDSGKPIIFDENKAAKILAEHKIYIDMHLSEGRQSATAWGCDLTYDYVKINGDYRS